MNARPPPKDKPPTKKKTVTTLKNTIKYLQLKLNTYKTNTQ